jgi:predicted transcriptional regulator
MGAELDKKRAVGRPMKAPQRGKRAPLSLLVRPDIKRRVDKLATANGITQSAQGEALIEQGLAVRQVLDAMDKTLAEIEAGNVHAALLRLGYSVERYTDPNGKTWMAYREPGHPAGVSPGAVVTAIAQEQEPK